MRNLLVLVLMSTMIALVPTSSGAASDDVGQILLLIKQWITPGYYDNSAQVAHEAELKTAYNLRHEAVFQLLTPVDVPKLEGMIYFRQSYSDADRLRIVTVGLLQYLADPKAEAVRLRELHFGAEEDFYDAYKTPEVLTALTAGDLWWDDGCDFLLTVDKAATEVRGSIEQGACVIDNEMSDMKLIAEDEVVIRPGEFLFWGRYLDDDGNVLWGTESEELNKLKFAGRVP